MTPEPDDLPATTPVAADPDSTPDPKNQPGRFSIPALAAGFGLPALVYALCATGVAGLPSLFDIAVPQIRYHNYDDLGVLPDIPAARNDGLVADPGLYVTYYEPTVATVQAAADAPSLPTDARWVFNGQVRDTQATIAALKAYWDSTNPDAARTVELTCFKADEVGVQGALFAFSALDGSLETFNAYPSDLQNKLATYQVGPPYPTQHDFSACIGLKQGVDTALSQEGGK